MGWQILFVDRVIDLLTDGKTGEIIVGDAEGVWRTRTIRRKPEAERWRDTHTSIVVGVPWNHGKRDLVPDGEALPAVTLEPREIEDAKVQDNERLDVDIGESDTETRKKRRITFKERPTHEDEDDFGRGTRAQSSGELGVTRSHESEEPCQMEVVLPQMRISGKRSQDHQEEQQAKKAKNSDEEMDIGKIEDEEDDGYQLNTNGSSWEGLHGESAIYQESSLEILETVVSSD